MGRMIQASTSVPSFDVAVNRSGADSSLAPVNAVPTLVTVRSATNSSDCSVGVDGAWTTRPAAASQPVTWRSPPIRSSGFPDPSAGTRYSG